MTTRRALLIALSIGLAAVLAGCGGGDSGGGGNGGGGNGGSTSYLPMKLGNTWHYRMTLAPDVVPAQATGNQLFDYHEEVIGIASLSGKDYFIVRSTRDATAQYPERVWQQIRREDREAIYARVGDPAYDLPVLMLPPQRGESWSDPFFAEVTFTVAAVGEQVTVPAGTFGCVRVEERWEEAVVGGAPITHVIKSWYARGVGLVKDETWEDEAKTSMIELTSYTIL